jgi:hypothetical protein
MQQMQEITLTVQNVLGQVRYVECFFNVEKKLPIPTYRLFGW